MNELDVRGAIGAVAALRGVALAWAMVTGPAGARGDELSDLRVNQQLLRERLDQLAQQPGQSPFLSAAPPDTPATAGSFPRSFLIPGTDTSLRIGGSVEGEAVWFIHGMSPNGSLFGQGGNSQTCPDGLLAACTLATIPLDTRGQNVSGNILNATAGHSRSSYVDESSRFSRINFDARTPTPWGEARAFIEFDFAAGGAGNDSVYSNLTGVSNGWIPRLRKAFATLGGLQAGQDNGAFRDVSSEGEFLSSSDEGFAGRARVSDIRYTWTAPNGFTFRVAAANPVSDGDTPNGPVYEDTTPIPTAGACSAPSGTAALAATSAAVVAGNTTVACLGAGAEFDPFQNTMPDWIATQRWEQPWGHVQLGEALREISLNDGKFLNQKLIGYGFYLSGDLRPFFASAGASVKDDIGWGFGMGNGIGGLISDCNSVTTNFGAGAANPASNFTANRALYDAGVASKTTPCWGAHVDLLHWWTDALRTNLAFGLSHADIATPLVIGQNCIRTGGSAATNNCSSGGAGLNKELDLAVINLIWSPVSFVDLGVEYACGHRDTLANLRGNASLLSAALKVKF